MSPSSLHYALRACEAGAQWQLALELGGRGGGAGGAMAALVAGGKTIGKPWENGGLMGFTGILMGFEWN